MAQRGRKHQSVRRAVSQRRRGCLA